MRFLLMISLMASWLVEARESPVSSRILDIRAPSWDRAIKLLVKRSGGPTRPRNAPAGMGGSQLPQRAKSPGRTSDNQPPSGPGVAGLRPSGSSSPSSSSGGSDPSSPRARIPSPPSSPKHDVNALLTMNGPGKVTVQHFDKQYKHTSIEKHEIDIPTGRNKQELVKEFTSPHRMEMNIQSQPGASHQVTAVGTFASVKTETSKDDESKSISQAYSALGGKKTSTSQDGIRPVYGQHSFAKAMSHRQSGAGVTSTLEGAGETTLFVDNYKRKGSGKPGKRQSNHPLDLNNFKD